MCNNSGRIRCLSFYIDLLENHGILKEAPADVPGLKIKNATDDSRRVVPGTLFVCKGAAFKRSYLLEAAERGAVAYVSEKDYGVDIPCVATGDIRRAMALIADGALDHPSGRISICAITGTKGKTTSAYYLKGILDARARRLRLPTTPILSSVLIDDGATSGISSLTTPEPFELERHVTNAVASGADHLVMEVSSQALKYERTYGIEFAVGAFTNIGEDHISPVEHPTFDDYFDSKLKIFAQSRTAVVNLDMDYVERALDAASRCEKTVTFSLNDPTADVFVQHAVRVGDGLDVLVRIAKVAQSVHIPTPAMFNVPNAACAIACAVALGVNQTDISHGLEHVGVPGRMELLPSTSGRIIGVIDFAHNGMSLETLLRDLRESYPDRELCVVFGATGRKGVDRRRTMGEAAGRYADRIVITEDDPGPESVEDICETIARHVQAQGCSAWKIVLDRNEAIRTAVRETSKPTVLVVSGKGHETRMLRKNGAEPCEADGPMLRRALDDLDAADDR